VRVACWSNAQGPAAVFLLSARPGTVSDSAHVPGCPPAPARQWAARGHGVSWGQWAAHLTMRPPYEGQWTVEDVPDGFDARHALYHLRQAAVEYGLTQAKQPGTV
jgi:hypothetical protein